MQRYRSILKQYWNYDAFRGIQEDIIESIGSGRDTLGLMPTGGGKSITFQVPALAQPGLCLVVTPLIALMKDQVHNLRMRGIKATAVYAGMTRQEIIIALENCIFGDYKFLYISPERLSTELFQQKLRKMNISFITVDEAHCISQWGYDFRPAYLKIAEIRNLLPNAPVLALTATATPAVVDDIQARLAFKQTNVFRMSFERKNLAYVVRACEEKESQLYKILRNVPGSAIVYTRNRKRTKEIAEKLTEEGFSATFYHAGLNNVLKDKRQTEWQKGDCRVMVATNAFGMGIDKPDVRLVIHMDLPDSPEAYFQEAGRAGRDGQKAYAVILCSKADQTNLKRRITDTFPEKEYIRDVYENLNYYYQMAMGDGQGCVYDFDLEEFCRRFHYFPVPADSALTILTQAGYIEYTEEQDNASRLIFTIRRDELYRLHEGDEVQERIVQTILRSYTGVFSDYTYINEETIGLRSNLTRAQVYEQLQALSRRRVIDYIPHKKTPFIVYTRERVDAKHLSIPLAVYEERRQRYTDRIQAMLNYVSTEGACRSRQLLNYFGEKTNHDCNQCDVCLNNRKKKINDHDFDALCKQIYTILQKGSITPHALMEQSSLPQERLDTLLSHLVHEEIIYLKDGEIRVNQSLHT